MNSWLPDVYTLRARIVPIVIVATPLAVAAFACSPGTGTWTNLGVGAGLWIVVSTVIGQMGRDRGRRSQAALFTRWGGSPTTRRLRHRETQNVTQLHRRHEQLAMITGLKLPTTEEEARDPVRADEIYEPCIGVLREKTRDKKMFNIVFEENCSFGFRRNLWALKRFGVAVALGVLVAAAVVLYLGVASGATQSAASLAVLLASVLVLIGWGFVTTDWVALAAEAYAEALLGACERMYGTNTTDGKRMKLARTGRGRS